MKKIFLLCLLAVSTAAVFAQTKEAKESKTKFGAKAGYNWSYITGSADGFKKSNQTGFMASLFYATPSKGKGFRSEIVFSRQGYSFDDGGKNTEVMNDYVYLPQLTTFTIAGKVQLQLGGQIGFLLNSKKTSNGTDSTVTGFMNRLDYGFAGGLEIYPFKGLILGGRYNLGLGKLYKKYEQGSTPSPFPLPFDPDKTNFKNGLIQFFVGYKF